MKSLFADLKIAKMQVDNPFDLFKRMPRDSTPSLYYQPFQVTLIKDYVSREDPQLWLFVQFIFYCFIRPGELRQLRMSDILFSEGKIMIRKEISKNKKTQMVTMPRVFLQELLRHNWHRAPKNYFAFGSGQVPGPVAVGINYMKIRHQRILKDLNINTDRHKLYSWKHTGAVRFAKSGGSLKDLQLQLRHHSLDQVDHYLKDMLSGESESILNLPGI